MIAAKYSDKIKHIDLVLSSTCVICAGGIWQRHNIDSIFSMGIASIPTEVVTMENFRVNKINNQKDSVMAAGHIFVVVVTIANGKHMIYQ